jgi:hypothetical protein
MKMVLLFIIGKKCYSMRKLFSYIPCYYFSAAKDSCKILTRNDMLLLDSGGQYLDGTTGNGIEISLSSSHSLFRCYENIALW